MVTVTHIANAALCIRARRKTILVDAIYDQPPQGFSPMGQVDSAALMEAQPPFDGVGHVLFSHFHPDHFSGEMTKRYAQRHKPHIVLKQGDEAKALCSLTECTVIPKEEGSVHAVPLADGDLIEAFCIRHSGAEYARVTNVCYRLRLDGKCILILGDADFDPDYFFKMAGEERIDLLIANPLFLVVPQGRKVLFEALRAEGIAIYHLPFEADDAYGMRELVHRTQKRKQSPVPVILFDEYTKQIVL